MNKDIGKPNVYSGMKILHHEERFRQWLQYEFEMDKTGESDNMIYPIMVEMHLNTRACNHNCFLEDIRGCGGNWPIKNTQWTRQEGLNFLNQLKTAEVKSIPFSGGGEPMFHPNFDEFLSEASTFADVGLITHGGRIDSFSRAKSIVEKATWVRVSIGGATEETYRGRHGIGRTEVQNCWRGLEYLIQARKEVIKEREFIGMPESVCTIGVGFLTNSQVSHEIYPLTGIVREIGADYLSVRPDHYSTDDSSFLIEKARSDFQNQSFSVFAPYMKFNNMGEQIKKINPLIEVPYKDHFSTVAGGDGEGNLDCFNVNREQGDYGNFIKDSFETVWRSQVRVKKLKSFLKDPRTHYRSHYDITSKYLTDFRQAYLVTNSEAEREDLVQSWILNRDQNVKHVNFINN